MVNGLRQLGAKFRHFLRQYRFGLTFSSLVCLASFALYIPLYMVPHHLVLLQFLNELELRTLDMRFRLRGVRPPSPAVGG